MGYFFIFIEKPINNEVLRLYHLNMYNLTDRLWENMYDSSNKCWPDSRNEPTTTHAKNGDWRPVNIDTSPKVH